MTTHNSTIAPAENAESTTHNSTGLPKASTPGELTEAHARLLADYRAELEAQPDLSRHTRNAYVAAVRRFATWLDDPDTDSGDYTDDPLIDADARAWAIADWRQAAITGQVRDRYGDWTSLSNATIKATLAGLSDFYLRGGMCSLDSREIARPQTSKRAPAAVRGRDRVRLDREIARLDESRDRAIAGVMRYAGLRKGEVVALSMADVTLSARKGTLRVIGKGSKVRHVPVSQQLREILQAWLADRPRVLVDTSERALFVTFRGGRRMSPRSITDIVKVLAERTGLDDLTPHVLRHTFATELVRDRDIDLVTVADLLGHASIEITRTYATASDDDLAAAVEAIDTSHLS